MGTPQFLRSVGGTAVTQESFDRRQRLLEYREMDPEAFDARMSNRVNYYLHTGSPHLGAGVGGKNLIDIAQNDVLGEMDALMFVRAQRAKEKKAWTLRSAQQTVRNPMVY